METKGKYVELRDLQKMGIRGIIFPIPRTQRSRLKEKKEEAIREFRKTDSLQAKREMVIRWNLQNPGFEVSIASLYRWNRKDRLASCKASGDPRKG